MVDLEVSDFALTIMPTTCTPLLTVAIPTYNRLECLKLLVQSLCAQIDQIPDIGGKIQLLIADNQSTDGTTAYIKALDRSYLTVHTHEVNLGADYNVRFCFRQAAGQFVWIIGDDDLPRLGALGFLADILSKDKIDLLFLRSEWINTDLSASINTKYIERNIEFVSSDRFVRVAAVYLTFLSGMVVNKARYEEIKGQAMIDRFNDTWLPHLEWILALLRQERYLAITSDVLLFARGANTGGYSVIKAFGVNFPTIVKNELGIDSPLTKIILRRLLLTWLPVWVWRMIHRNEMGAFENDMPWDEMDKVFGSDIAYRFVVKPIRYAPKWVGAVFVAIGRMFKYV